MSSDQSALPLSPLGDREPLRAITKSLGSLDCDRLSFMRRKKVLLIGSSSDG